MNPEKVGMNYEQFMASLQKTTPPAELSLALQALWYDANDDWKQAHELAQQDDSKDGAWVHAYLHRVEGDLANAGYWYRRAGRAAEQGALAEERAALIRALLA